MNQYAERRILRQSVSFLRQPLTRRQLLAGIGSIFAATLVREAAGAAEVERYSLSAAPDSPRVRQVVVQLKAEGELKLNAAGQKISRKPIQVTGEFSYEERLPDVIADRPDSTGSAAGGRQKGGAPAASDSKTPIAKSLRPVLRHYEKARADIELGTKKFATTLAEQRRLIAVQRVDEHLVTWAPAGPLTRDDLELIDVPGSSTILEDWLPGAELAIGDQWEVSPEHLARSLNLDAVSESKVKGLLKKVEAQVAIVQFEGTLSGAVGGVATEIELAGKLNFDLSRGFVTWLALGLKENRSIGHAEPGFETTTQVRVQVKPQRDAAQLQESAVAGLPLEYQPQNALLNFESTAGRYRMLLDRRWRSMVDRPDLTILRFVDQGDLIAQANLTRLPALAPGKQLSLEALQDDIKQSLSKSFRQFVEASQATTDDGLRVLRVVAVGEVSELAVQWNYYHVSDQAGQRLALVFTLESNLVERFAESDRPIVTSIQFTGAAPDLPPEKEPAGEPAPKSGAAKPPTGDKARIVPAPGASVASPVRGPTPARR